MMIIYAYANSDSTSTYSNDTLSETWTTSDTMLSEATHRIYLDEIESFMRTVTSKIAFVTDWEMVSDRFKQILDSIKQVILGIRHEAKTFFRRVLPCNRKGIGLRLKFRK